MPRIPTRPLVLTLALVALLALSPVAATAQAPGRPTPSAAERPDPGLFSQFWSLLSAFWADTGSGLDPNGVPTTDPGTEPGSVDPDTGSGLDPNG